MKKNINVFLKTLITSLFLMFGAIFLVSGLSSKGKVYAAEDYPHESFEDGKWVREVTSWDDMDHMFENMYSNLFFQYGSLTIKLTTDLSMNANGIANNALYMKQYNVGWSHNVIFDFNGHKLIGDDNISSTNMSSKLQDFIIFYMTGGSTLTFEDSVGGGGIEFYSSRAYDTNNLSALRIEGVGEGNLGTELGDKVIFNGGTYKMTAKTAKIGVGTLDYDVFYRGTVIADHVNTVINDGLFIAKSEGLVLKGTDFCGRELSAFATVDANIINHYRNYDDLESYICNKNVIINGGVFESDGYAIHHFDNCRLLFESDGNFGWAYEPRLGDTYFIEYPVINGGIFKGQMGFTGLTFTYSDGNPELEQLPANMIINENASFYGKLASGKKVYSTDGLDWDDLHDIEQCMVISDSSIDLITTPESSGETTKLVRTERDSDTFKIENEKPYWLTYVGASYQTSIEVIRKNSGSASKFYYNKDVTIDYSEFKNGCIVKATLLVSVNDEVFLKTVEFDIDVREYFNVLFTSSSHYIQVLGENQVMEALEGSNFQFKIFLNPYYEMVDESNFIVEVNGEILTPNNGIYTVDDVDSKLYISTSGVGVKGYSNLTFSPGSKGNGTNKKYKHYVGETITLPDPADLGFTFSTGIEFTGWKIGNKLYQVGDTYTITKTGELSVVCQTKGIYTIEIINGSAYSDSEHTNVITEAKDNDYVYIVANEPEEGFRFSYWSVTPHVSGCSVWLETEYTESESLFKIWDPTGVTIEAVYVKDVDEIILDGVIKPMDNEEYKLDHDLTYENISISVPDDARGYTYSAPAYMYDITGYLDEEVNSRNKINSLGLTQMSEGDLFIGGNTYLYSLSVHLKATYDDQDFKYSFPVDPSTINVLLNGLKSEDYEIIAIEFIDSAETYISVLVKFECEIIDIHELIVENGTGSGEYMPGDEVEIQPNEAPEGKQFKEWSCDEELEILFSDSNTGLLIFVMPNKDITISAIYEDIKVYVTGDIISYGLEDDIISISLFKEGIEEAVYEITLTGFKVLYAIEDVLPGDYILKATKANHISFEENVTITYLDDLKKNIELKPICIDNDELHIDSDEDYFCDLCHQILIDYVLEDDLKTFIFEIEENVETNLKKLFDAISNEEGALKIIIGDTTLLFNSNLVNDIALSENITLKVILLKELLKDEDALAVLELSLNDYTFTDNNVLVSFNLDYVLNSNEEIKLYYLDGDNRIEIDYSYNDGVITFEANHFSSYLVTLLVNEVAKELVSIELSGNAKLEFNLGDEFTYEGLIVTAKYSDDTNIVVTDYVVSGYDKDKEGKQDITVSYTEDGITKTTTYEINVKTQVVDDITPVKTNNGLPTGAVVGIILGVVALVAVAGVVIFIVIKKRK